MPGDMPPSRRLQALDVWCVASNRAEVEDCGARGSASARTEARHERHFAALIRVALQHRSRHGPIAAGSNRSGGWPRSEPLHGERLRRRLGLPCGRIDEIYRRAVVFELDPCDSMVIHSTAQHNDAASKSRPRSQRRQPHGESRESSHWQQGHPRVDAAEWLRFDGQSSARSSASVPLSDTSTSDFADVNVAAGDAVPVPESKGSGFLRRPLPEA